MDFNTLWNTFAYGLPLKRRRSVHFADEIGERLIEICLFTDDYLFSKEALAANDYDQHFMQEAAAISHASGTARLMSQAASWRIDFDQPCHNYNGMIEKVKSQGVSLANVYVNNIRETLSGTVKVNKQPGTKDVIIRYTIDGWLTHKDQTCRLRKFNANDPDDTFTFEIDVMSMNSHQIHFCLRYTLDTCNGRQEYWDNNSNANYTLTNLNKL